MGEEGGRGGEEGGTGGRSQQVAGSQSGTQAGVLSEISRNRGLWVLVLRTKEEGILTAACSSRAGVPFFWEASAGGRGGGVLKAKLFSLKPDREQKAIRQTIIVSSLPGMFCLSM